VTSNHRQFQLCVPLVAISGPSYRVKNRLAAIGGDAEVA
jgi:hypothetical protein